jgi:hypothetical protein
MIAAVNFAKEVIKSQPYRQPRASMYAGKSCGFRGKMDDDSAAQNLDLSLEIHLTQKCTVQRTLDIDSVLSRHQ